MQILFSQSGFCQVEVQNFEKKLIGVWKADKFKIVENLKIDDQRKFNEMSENQKRVFNKTIESRVFHFFMDSTFMATWDFNGQQHSVRGTWKYFEKNILVISLPGEEKTYTVGFSEGNLVITPQVSVGGMLQKLFFTKSN